MTIDEPRALLGPSWDGVDYHENFRVASESPALRAPAAARPFSSQRSVYAGDVRRAPLSVFCFAAFGLCLGGCQAPDPAPESRPKVHFQPPIERPAPILAKRTPAEPTVSERRVADAPPEPDLHPNLPPGEAHELFAKGDAAAEGKRYAEALSLWRWAYVRALPEIRELAFLYPVRARFMDRPRLRERIGAELQKEMPPQKMRAERLAAVRFGFFDPKLDLSKLMNDLYAEEIAGFYDPETKELFLIAEGAAADEERGLVDLLLGTGGFDKEEQRAVLSHELQHALADQHFDLYSLHLATKNDDDMALAATGLIEGEAMVVMILDLVPEAERKDFLLAPPAVLSSLMKLALPLAAGFAAGDAFGRAPKLLQESLLMPYLEGMRFCLTLIQEAGWQRVDEAFSRPPLSTEHLLHPERFLEAYDPPTALAFQNPVPAPLDGWELVKENTLGEFQIRVRLSMALSGLVADGAADGWDGDRYRVYRPKGTASDTLALVWATTWDSPREAVEFESAAQKTFPATETGRRIWRKGADVWVLLGIPDAAMSSMVAWAERLTRSEKTVQIVKKAPKKPFPPVPDPVLSTLPRPRKTGKPELGYDPAAAPLLKLLGMSDRKLVAEGVRFVDRVCACPDLDCVARVDEEMSVWYEAARQKRLIVPEFEELKAAFLRHRECVLELAGR